jgi:hypothetical protein
VSLVDFLSGEDQLVLLYPDGAESDPDVEIDVGAQETRVLMDGAVVAVLPAGTVIGMGDIALMPESAAGQLLYPS